MKKRPWGEHTPTGRECITCGGDIYIIPGGGSIEFQMSTVRCVDCAHKLAAEQSARACDGYGALQERKRVARLRADEIE